MRKINYTKVTGLFICIGSIGFIGSTCSQTIAQPTATNYQITVNSDRDGDIQSDRELTLREAIAIANGSLTLDRLSETERAQIKPIANSKGSQIGFNLPSDRTTIKLSKALPALSRENLTIDGTTQTG